MNKKGYTMIELILAVFILVIACGGFLPLYSSYANNVTEISTLMNNQIIKTQQQGLSMSSINRYTVNGVSNQYPYIKFNNSTMEFLEPTSNGNVMAITTRNYLKNPTPQIKITTTLDNNTVYFNKSGLPCKADGTILNSYSIYITKTDSNVKQVLTSDDIGNISISN